MHISIMHNNMLNKNDMRAYEGIGTNMIKTGRNNLARMHKIVRGCVHTESRLCVPTLSLSDHAHPSAMERSVRIGKPRYSNTHRVG